MQKNDLVGRLLGMLVFIGGVGLLAFVFYIAYSLFSSDLVGAQGGAEPAAAQLGRIVINLLARIGMLVVMTIIGSMIASRGIQLYFASGNRRESKREPITDAIE